MAKRDWKKRATYLERRIRGITNGNPELPMGYYSSSEMREAWLVGEEWKLYAIRLARELKKIALWNSV